MKSGTKVRTTCDLVVIGFGNDIPAREEIPAGEEFTVARWFDTDDGPRLAIWNAERLLFQVRTDQVEEIHE